MPTSAPPGPSARPLDGGPDAPSLAELLADLRRRAWDTPTEAGKGLVEVAARALRAETVVIWLRGDGGALNPVVHHPLGIDPCGRPPTVADAGEPPSLADVAATSAPTLERVANGADVLDAGLWVRGTLVGTLSAQRSVPAAWRDDERAFLVGVADRLAAEVVGERRRVAELALAQREQQIRQIERLAGMGTWDFDLVTDRITWSPEQLRIHGLDDASAPRNEAGFLALVHPDDRSRIVDVMQRLITTNTPFIVEYPIVRPDGEVRLLQAPGQLVAADDGRLTRMIGTSHDITERRATELALRASEESYRAIFDSSNDAIFVHDLATDAVLDANRRACEVNAVTLEELRANGMSIIANAPPPFTAERARAHMERAAGGEPVRFEWMTLHPTTDEEMWVEVSLQHVSIRGADRLLALVRDIRDRKRVELALQASEESYRLIFQNASDAIWLHDIDTGDFLEANAAACEMYGYTPDEMRVVGVAGLSDGRPPYSPAEARAFVQRAAAGEPQRFEWLGRHKDGRAVWGEVRLRRVSIGGVDRILATARDIGARKAAEAALRQANEELEQRVAARTAELAATNVALAQAVAEHAQAKEALLERTRELEGIFQALPDLYFRLDAAGTILDYRAGNGQALYVPPDVFLGRQLREIMPAEICDRFDAAFTAAAQGALVCVEYQLVVADESRDYEARFLPLGDGTRISVIRDITEAKEAERALREREEHFRRLIENTSDLITFVDADGTVRYQSPSVESMLGYRPGSHDGRSTFEHVHPDDRAATAAVFADLVARPGASRSAIYRLRHRDGGWRVVESIARTILPDSASEGVVINSRDITERQHAESALARAKEDAERANRAKSEFLSRMSHELRTPMNSILGFAQLLGRAELPPQQGKSVQHILKAGRHLLRLINEVLEIARIEAGRDDLSLEPVALASVLQEAFGLVRPVAQQWEVELREAPWPRDAFVQADRQRFVQVLLNLLSNAIKYNRPNGHVRLTCAPNEGGWTVRVEDSGRGIPPERADQLFTPFARLGAEQTDVEGTGLGLALSQRLSEAMGGVLALESTGESGSIFRLDLAGAEDPLRALEETGAFVAVTAPHREATLLYVEDNLANLTLVDTILLSRPGWRTIPALQGQIGVELAREHVPDLVLLDLHLPDISGEEVLRRLRADPRTADIPIVVVSADATSSSLERLRAAGADAYLTKPLDVDQFLEVVERFLPGRSGGAW